MTNLPVPKDDQSSKIFLYEAACRAVSEALTIDEVMEINNRAEAVRAYAKIASNFELEIQAAEIRLRATRRLGQLLIAIKSDGQIEPPEHANKKEMKKWRWKKMLTGAELGINQAISLKALKAATPTDDQFNNLICSWKERCINSGRVSVTLEAKPDRRSRFETNYAEHQQTMFDTFYLHVLDGQPIGDLQLNCIEWNVRRLLDEFSNMARQIEISLYVLTAIKNHFGGGIALGKDNKPIELRDALSLAKLCEFVEAAEAGSRGLLTWPPKS